MKLIENHLYSLKRDLSSLLVYRKHYSKGMHIAIKLWPLANINPAPIDVLLLRFPRKEEITEVEPNYFETSMSLKPVRRHNLMRALWGIKW